MEARCCVSEGETWIVELHCLRHLQQAAIQPHLLPFWYDVDNAEDLQRLKWHAQVLSNNETGMGQNTFEQINTFQEGSL